MKIKHIFITQKRSLLAKLLKVGYRKLAIGIVALTFVTTGVLVSAKTVFNPNKATTNQVSNEESEVLGTSELEDKTEENLIPTQTPEVLPKNTHQPTTTLPQPTQKVDSAVSIEICRTQAKEKRKEEERKVNEEYARSEPAIVELANTQNNGQTEAVALKYGYITEKDIVRSADVFIKLINEGYPTETARSMAESMLSSYSAYLRSLHDWAANELSKWDTLVKARFDAYENEVYKSCLTSL